MVLQQTKPAEMDWFGETAEETAWQVRTGADRLLWGGVLRVDRHPVTTRDNQVKDKSMTENDHISAVTTLLLTSCFSRRYQYYLQLKKDVLEGKIPCSIEQAIHLASLAVQGIFFLW